MDAIRDLTLICLLFAAAQPTQGQSEATTQGQSEATTQGSTNETESMTTVSTTTYSTTYSTEMTTQELLHCNETGCFNNGTCLINGTCSCTDWYAGDNCEIMTECPPESCSPKGSLNCTVIMSRPVCNCLPDYLGTRCEHENLCLKHPCRNNGTCETIDQGGYKCTCVTGDPHRDCAFNEFDACKNNPPAGVDQYVACIDLVVGKTMLCAPEFTGVGCNEPRNSTEYCTANGCFSETGFCQPLCNSEECNGAPACNFTEFSSDGFSNMTTDCRRSFADGYDSAQCKNEVDLFSGYSAIRNTLKDCSPFFNTICTQNISDRICNPHCNNQDCLWDGLDCVTQNLKTFDGSIMIELTTPASARQYSQFGLVLRSGVYYNEFYSHGSPLQLLQLKVVKPSELRNDSNTTLGQFTSIRSAGMFLAAFAAKLPLNVTGITDIYVCEAGRYGKKCSDRCSDYCTKKGDICDFKTGKCLHGCRTLWWGAGCRDPCPQGCSGQCDRYSGRCQNCVPGRYGAENCSNDCDSYCRNIECNVISGYCNCGNGRYFSLALSKCLECSAGCEGPCGASGNCSCKEGFFGTMCDARCSATCSTNECDAIVGRCMGCKAGYYGDSCEKKCGNGCVECQQDSGSCAGKCKDGFEGNDCKPQRSTHVTNNTGVIVAVVVAVIIILIVIIIAVCYWKYRQAGDYVLKDEEEEEPIPKVTSQEVKAHYGMQPLHVSPLEGHSSEMIDMDSKPIGGVYAGPGVTVTYTKEGESLAIDNTTKNPAEDGDEEPDVNESELPKMDAHMNETAVPVNLDSGANHIEGTENSEKKLNENADEERANEEDAKDERKQNAIIRAPLASEEDLTAPEVHKGGTSNPPPPSMESLENEALDALDHLEEESNSKRSSKSSEQSKHSSSSSSSSKSSKNDKDEGSQQLTEM